MLITDMTDADFARHFLHSGLEEDNSVRGMHEGFTPPSVRDESLDLEPSPSKGAEGAVETGTESVAEMQAAILDMRQQIGQMTEAMAVNRQTQVHQEQLLHQQAEVITRLEDQVKVQSASEQRQDALLQEQADRLHSVDEELSKAKKALAYFSTLIPRLTQLKDRVLHSAGRLAQDRERLSSAHAAYSNQAQHDASRWEAADMADAQTDVEREIVRRKHADLARTLPKRVLVEDRSRESEPTHNLRLLRPIPPRPVEEAHQEIPLVTVDERVSEAPATEREITAESPTHIDALRSGESAHLDAESVKLANDIASIVQSPTFPESQKNNAVYYQFARNQQHVVIRRLLTQRFKDAPDPQVEARRFLQGVLTTARSLQIDGRHAA
jgi:hypothetical protein